MADFLIRAEDIPDDKILDYFVETQKDRSIVDALKKRSPVLLEGSRGVGKSFLLRVCERELSSKINEDRVLPVYVQLTKSILVDTSNESQFHYWTLARLAVGLLRSLRSHGAAVNLDREISIIGGNPEEGAPDPINETVKEFEDSYLNRNKEVNTSSVPGVEEFKFGVEDICRKADLERIVVLFDEAAHVLQPEHQRQFFTLFRDLRSPYISCNAAVYPGIMSFGDTFEQSHDATTVRVERDIRSDKYRDEMRSIVDVQAGSETMKHVERQGQNFDTLAYAASGNPRFLLKTLSQVPYLKTSDTTSTIRKYYRNDLWAEHSRLANRFPGLQTLIDWGAEFLKQDVLPRIHSKNEDSSSETTRFFWVQDDAPAAVYKSLQLLMYSGIISIDNNSVVATRDWVGTRYAVNLGVLFANAATTLDESFQIASNLSPTNPVLYNKNHKLFDEIKGSDILESSSDNSFLDEMLDRSIDELDLTDFQKKRLREQDLSTIGDVLASSEHILKKGYYIGDVRSRQMHNAAQAAVMEYLAG